MTIVNPAEMMIDSSLKAFGALCWAQEQGEKVTQSWLAQNRVNREEAQKFAQAVSDQVKENQKLMQNVVNSAVRMSLESYRIASQQTVAELTKKVEELSAQVANLTTRLGAQV